MVRCPLPSHNHFDRSPSLRLYLDDGIWHCFGCGQMGDVVEWVCQSEGVGWRQAIRILDSGCALTRAWAASEPVSTRRSHSSGRRTQTTSVRSLETPGRADYPDLYRTPATRVFDALAFAWVYYSSCSLHESGAVYLERRGIDVAVLEALTGRHEVGHTPSGRDALVTPMLAQGFTADELVDAGLAHRGANGRITDFYCQRVLIPIRDEESRICGFVGRNVGDDCWPKYKNPPHTHAYDKSVNLYQPLPAPSAGKCGQVIVVEGTLDAMAIAVTAIQAGRAGEFCPVTQSGRELSVEQLERAVSLNDGPLVLGFDGDAAGRDSARRHAATATRLGHAVLVTTLPGDHDPASWLAERGASGLRAWVVTDALDQGRSSPRPVPTGRYLATQLVAVQTMPDPALLVTAEGPTL
jgi:DNA primase